MGIKDSVTTACNFFRTTFIKFLRQSTCYSSMHAFLLTIWSTSSSMICFCTSSLYANFFRTSTQFIDSTHNISCFLLHTFFTDSYSLLSLCITLVPLLYSFVCSLCSLRQRKFHLTQLCSSSISVIFLSIIEIRS